MSEPTELEIRDQHFESLQQENTTLKTANDELNAALCAEALRVDKAEAANTELLLTNKGLVDESLTFYHADGTTSQMLTKEGAVNARVQAARKIVALTDTLVWIADSGINGKHYQSHSSLVKLAEKTIKENKE